MTIRHIIMTLNHYMVVKSQQLLRTTSFRHLLLLPRRESSFDPEDAKKRLSGVQVTISLKYFDHDFKFSVVQTTHCLVISSCFTSYMIQSCLSSVDLWQDSMLGHTEESRTPFCQNIPSQELRAVPTNIIQAPARQDSCIRVAFEQDTVAATRQVDQYHKVILLSRKGCSFPSTYLQDSFNVGLDKVVFFFSR